MNHKTQEIIYAVLSTVLLAVMIWLVIGGWLLEPVQYSKDTREAIEYAKAYDQYRTVPLPECNPSDWDTPKEMMDCQ